MKLLGAVIGDEDRILLGNEDGRELGSLLDDMDLNLVKMTVLKNKSSLALHLVHFLEMKKDHHLVRKLELNLVHCLVRMKVYYFALGLVLC